MKVLFSLFISLSVILFSSAQTITDGSASLEMTQDLITGTGCGSNANFDAGNGIDQLFGFDWFIGVGDMISQNFPSPDSYTETDNTITALYADLLGISGLDAELNIVLTEMAPLDVQIAQNMQIINNTGAALDVRLFNYVDLDKNNTQNDNAEIFLEDDCNFATQITSADDPSQVCYFTINASDGYEMSSFPSLCKKILGGVMNLDNTGLPLLASDHSQALQYNANIPSGGASTAEALLTFGNPPEPATTDASGQCTFGEGISGGEDCVTPDAATIEFADGSTAASICVDGIPDPLDVVTDGGTGASSGWIITDDSNNILALPAAPPFDLDGAGVGTCLIWYVTYDDIDGNVVGNNAADLTGCFALSNSIEVVREECGPPPPDCTSIPIVINHNLTCQGNGTYNVQFSISGGGAGFQGGIYNVTGDFTGAVAAGEVINITGLAEGSIYNITVINDGFGCSAAISKGPNNCSKLPVELLDFSGDMQAEGNLLKWVTASEIENDYFSLYSSVNGEDFDLIHRQEGGGTISTAQQYKFLDRNASSGITYYRLSQTDFDGTTKIIAHTNVSRGEQLDFVLSNSFPSPFGNELNLNIYSNSNQNVFIRLITMLGNNVFQIQLNLQSGNNTVQLETDHLSVGLYMLNVQSNTHKQVYKLLKD